jgi:hypothetical protein
MGTGTRILAGIGAGLALLGAVAVRGANETASGVKVVVRAIDEAMTASKTVPGPVKHEIKKALGQMAKQEAKDVIWASCQLKDSPNIEQQARLHYGDRSEYKIGLIVILAKAMHADPVVGALCSQEF